MAQTADGAEKIAAKRAGVTLHEYRNKRIGGQKRCTKCRAWKGSDGFGSDRSRGDGLSAICTSCRTPARVNGGPGKQDRAAMRSKGLAWCRGCKAWLSSSAIRGGICQTHINEQYRDAYARAPAPFRDRTRARKAMKLHPPPKSAAHLKDLFDGRCAYCPAPGTTWDHLIPIARGGKTKPGNLVPACRPCNSSKGDRELWAWMEVRLNSPAARFDLHENLIDIIMLAEITP